MITSNRRADALPEVKVNFARRDKKYMVLVCVCVSIKISQPFTSIFCFLCAHFNIKKKNKYRLAYLIYMFFPAHRYRKSHNNKFSIPIFFSRIGPMRTQDAEKKQLLT